MPNPLTTARSLAQRHPNALLPCPVCGVGLRAANLDQHLTKAHDDEAPASPPLRGVDRNVWRLFLVPVLMWGLGAFASIFACSLTVTNTHIIVYGAVLMALLVPLVLAVCNVFRARLELLPDRLTLRHSLGLFTKVVPLPAALSVGRLQESRPDPTGGSSDHNTPGVLHDVGTYLRLFVNGRSLTIGTLAATDIRKHWQLTAARPTRKWDMTLARADFVALQYWLAERGLLELSRAA